jgi:uridine kinase
MTDQPILKHEGFLMKKPIVITIAAVSGGGKTTVISELKNRLLLSKAVYFDDYEFKEGPEDYVQWVQNGEDYNAWNLEELANDIDSLVKQNKLNYLLIDYPFAYKNDKITPYIDYAVFIDTPLDIAMARRLLRDMANQSSSLLKNDLNCYLSGGRIAYLEMIKAIKPNSDFIVDGCLSVEDIVSQIIEQILKLK